MLTRPKRGRHQQSSLQKKEVETSGRHAQNNGRGGGELPRQKESQRKVPNPLSYGLHRRKEKGSGHRVLE